MPGYVPYRGDGQPRYSKARRRFVNLRKERREVLRSIFKIILVSTIFFAFFAVKSDDSTGIGFIIFGSMFTLILVAGILSLNKFRKGYDVDISEGTDKDEKPDESKNLDS